MKLLIQDDTGSATMGTVMVNATGVLGTGEGARPLTCRTSLTLHSKQKVPHCPMLHRKQASEEEEEDVLGHPAGQWLP